MSANDNTCPIWGTPASPLSLATTVDELLKVDSPRAGGKYSINVVGRAAKMVEDLDYHAKVRLTTWLIKQRRLGDECPEIRSYEIESIIQRPPLSVHARADELLKYIQERTPFIGREFSFSSGSPPLEMFAYTESVYQEELVYLLDYLIAQDWLEVINAQLAGKLVAITVLGYGRLAELEQVVTDSSQAFVAMWFDDSLLPVWNNSIEPAIKDAGYKAFRIDKKEHLNKIDDEIIAEIRRSRFLVADFTQGDDGARGSVYYEAGFAYGLDIPVIFTCREDMIDRLHFDTRQYPHIVWNSPVDLKRQLEDRIGAVIGEGPLKKKDQG